jgi:hypothetical protein
MTEFYFSKNLENGWTLYIAPLTNRVIDQSGQVISDAGGYFLFQKNCADEMAETQIIAHVLSEEAALQLKDMFQMS